MIHRKQLPVPRAVEGDEKAVELLRVWAADGQQHVSLASNVWEDPAAWGIMLVDLAKHIASSYRANRSDDDLAAVLKRIREGFDAEWEVATDEPSGGLQEL